MSSATIRWGAGIVALGAVVATAHGLFEVAAAARVPGAIALTYPLITDGLALVAYAATTRLTGAASRYAWSVVVLAAGLSGAAQAFYLATDVTSTGTGEVVLVLHAALRFGIGAWPAIAAALVAHLLYLLVAAENTSAADDAPETPADGSVTWAAPARDVVAPPQEPPAGQPPAHDSAVDVDDDSAVHAWAVDRLRAGEHAGAGTLQKLGIPKRRAEALAAQARQRHADEQKPRLVSG